MLTLDLDRTLDISIVIKEVGPFKLNFTATKKEKGAIVL